MVRLVLRLGFGFYPWRGGVGGLGGWGGVWATTGWGVVLGAALVGLSAPCVCLVGSSDRPRFNTNKLLGLILTNLGLWKNLWLYSTSHHTNKCNKHDKIKEM
ncbi:hypothetical protein NHP21005_16140 [Helicobacter sp. NHP21005]|nr:hypothetical protein [Helicobacter sp. NHP21005]BEG57926.1 hypothetical protein NHP21005_16140 [Helicobacter sp. NHP21005]